MERDVNKVLDETFAQEDITACLSANKNGLLIGSRGNISHDSSGKLKALLDQAHKLDPDSSPPVLVIESANHHCLIHKCGVTGAIVKSVNKHS